MSTTEQQLLSDRLTHVVEGLNEYTREHPDAALTCAKIAGLMVGYDARWGQQEYRCVEKEQEFLLPIINPETGCASRTYTYGGKLDGIIDLHGQRFVLEHKSCSEDLSDPNSPYFRRLTIDSQVSLYSLSQLQHGFDVAGTVYDVVRKPTIRQKNLTKAQVKILDSEGRYLGFPVPDYAGEERETPYLYFIRLAQDTLENPLKYYARRTVYRLDDEIVEYAGELWNISDEMRRSRNGGKSAAYRNSGACMEYNTPCDFLGICSGHDHESSDKWKQKERVHNELETVQGDGRDVLSHSRMRCFQSCRRKHFYRYELGIERADDEERYALFFGKMLHDVLEHYWVSNFS